MASQPTVTVHPSPITITTSTTASTAASIVNKVQSTAKQHQSAPLPPDAFRPSLFICSLPATHPPLRFSRRFPFTRRRIVHSSLLLFFYFFWLPLYDIPV